jgi:hypothetical protein
VTKRSVKKEEIIYILSKGSCLKARQISVAGQISLTRQISLAEQIGLARQIGLAFL